MGNCLTIEDTVIDLVKKHNGSTLIINKHSDAIQQLVETQLKHTNLRALVKDKRRAWEGKYSKDGLSFEIQIINTKVVSKLDLEHWMEGSVDMKAATNFRDLYKPQIWVSSYAGSTLRYRFHDTHLELEYKQTVEMLWDSMVEIVALVSIPTSALSPYSTLDQKEEWTTECCIWQSIQSHLKDEFIKQIAPDLVPIRIVDEDVSSFDVKEPELGLPISTVLEYLVEEKNTFKWSTVAINWPAPSV